MTDRRTLVLGLAAGLFSTSAQDASALARSGHAWTLPFDGGRPRLRMIH